MDQWTQSEIQASLKTENNILTFGPILFPEPRVVAIEKLKVKNR